MEGNFWKYHNGKGLNKKTKVILIKFNKCVPKTVILKCPFGSVLLSLIISFY